MFSYPGAQISDPRSGFFQSWIRIPDLGVKKAMDPGSGSATLAPLSTALTANKGKASTCHTERKKRTMRFLKEWQLQSCKLAGVCMQMQLILTIIKQFGLL
jgi:hypothetical protein